jgi:hypothetical protein
MMYFTIMNRVCNNQNDWRQECIHSRLVILEQPDSIITEETMCSIFTTAIILIL